MVEESVEEAVVKGVSVINEDGGKAEGGECDK